MKRTVAGLLLLLVMVGVAIASAARADVVYDLTATFSAGNVILEHRLVNSSRMSICLFPDQADLADARFLDVSGQSVENIATTGTITAEQTIYIAYPDRAARTFVSTRTRSAVFRTTTDADRVTQVEFEMFAYDCRSLVAKNYLRLHPVFRRTVRVMVKREP